MIAAADPTTNPALGILIFALGGLAGAIFYLPFKGVKKWAWESYWLVYAVFGLVAVPWALALTKSPNVIAVLKQTPQKELLYCYICGAMWGVGGLTWGLMIRYLGVGLGLAIGCGLCSASGTLVPLIIKGEFGKLFGPESVMVQIAGMDIPIRPGLVSFAGVVVSILGIILVGLAGMSKESELPKEVKEKAVAEYSFKKGIFVAMFSGLMSSAMNYGLQGGEAMTNLASTVEPVTPLAWMGMPVLVVVLLGGFTVNFLWCLFLNLKNGTTGDYRKAGAPNIANLLLAGLAGAIWCSQFICFKTGEPEMGKASYVGWAVLMASAILFSTVLGIFLGEWKGTSARTRKRLALGLLLLLGSSAFACLSGYLGK